MKRKIEFWLTKTLKAPISKKLKVSNFETTCTMRKTLFEFEMIRTITKERNRVARFRTLGPQCVSFSKTSSSIFAKVDSVDDYNVLLAESVNLVNDRI